MSFDDWLYGPQVQLQRLQLQQARDQYDQLLTSKAAAAKLLDFGPGGSMAARPAGLDPTTGIDWNQARPEDTQYKTELTANAMGGPLAYIQAQIATQQAQAAKMAEPYTLKDGERRYQGGNLIAAAPDALTDYAKDLVASGMPVGSPQFNQAMADKRSKDTYNAETDPLKRQEMMANIAKSYADIARAGLPPGYQIAPGGAPSIPGVPPSALPPRAPIAPTGPGNAPASAQPMPPSALVATTATPRIVPIPGSPQEQELNAKKAADQNAYDSANGAFQALIDKAQEISNDKNLDNVTGIITGSSYVPTTHQASVDTLNNIDALKSRLVIGAMQAARQGSQSGATGFGALSEKELGVLENMVAKLDTRLDAPTFRKRLSEIQDYATNAQNRLTKARQMALGQPVQSGASGGWSAKRIN